MKIQELITGLKGDFARLRSDMNEDELQAVFRSIFRQMNRIGMLSASRRQALSKISTDLQNLLASQKSYMKLNAMQGDQDKARESFFKALGILRDELFQLLQKRDV